MIDHHVLRLAQRQLGLVSHTQLVELGHSRSTISRARTSQRLVPVLPAVFLVAPAPDTYETRCLAIYLWMNGVGFVSGPSAARLHGLARMRELPIEYTVPTHITRSPPDWIDLHRTSWYDEHVDRMRLPNDIVVASAERMLFGIAADIRTTRFTAAETRRQRRFDDAADDAWNLGLTTPQAMKSFLTSNRCRGKDGVTRLAAWVDKTLERDMPAQSYFERDLINALIDAGLPQPIRQHQLILQRHHPVKIDIAWPDIRLGIEPGHSRFHAGGSALERDTLRDLACAEAGWDIHRLTERARSDLAGNAGRIAGIYHQRSQFLTKSEG